MIVGIAFSGTITLGAVLLGAGVAIVGLVRFAVRAFQGAKQEANAELADKNAQLAEERADQLRKFLDEALAREQRVEKRLENATTELIRTKDQIAEQAGDLERLRQMPNLAEVLESNRATLAEVIQSFHDGFTRTEADAAERTASAVASLERFVGEQLAGHEQRAQERQTAILGVLSTIADRLGPDPPGASA